MLDDRYLAFGDLVGNNRLDSFTNLVAHPGVGMLFMIPGLVETLRVNGTASIVTDQPLLQRCAIGGVTPKVAIRVEVDECFIHCGAALRRGSVWDIDTWPSVDARPSAAAIVKRHAALDASPDQIQAGLNEYYEQRDLGGRRRSGVKLLAEVELGADLGDRLELRLEPVHMLLLAHEDRLSSSA